MPPREHATVRPVPGALLGVGVDAERIARFEKLASGAALWRHVYTPREAAHLAAQPRAALAFCAAFCCKEALCKGLGAPYAFTGCECLYRPGEAEQELALSPQLRERLGLALVLARFHERFPAERGECVVEAQLFGGPGSPEGGAAPQREDEGGRPGVRSQLETIAVAAVETDRARIEQLDFSPAEIADLGRRRVQSLAGALAAKRSLAALLLGASAGAAPAQPRDFALEHLASGAPRLVAAPPGFEGARFHVSIAHTREWAYGLAAVD